MPNEPATKLPALSLLRGEVQLGESPHWFRIPVKAGERYLFAGYSKSHVHERRDSALILFDFGEYEMSEEECRVHGLVKSRVGTFAYLPTGEEINSWCFAIPIPEAIGELGIGFRTWRNEHPVVIGGDIHIARDLSYSRVLSALQKERTRNEALHVALMNERQLAGKDRKTLSFQLGYILVHSVKSWKNFFRLPVDLVRLFRSHRQKRLYLRLGAVDSDQRWHTISDQVLQQSRSVEPGSRMELSGKIRVLPGERANAALVKIEVPEVVVAKESARRLGLLYSESLGLYAYLPTSEPGEREWRVQFTLPPFATKVRLTWMPWYNRLPIQITVDPTRIAEAPKEKVPRARLESMLALLDEQGEEAALASARDASLSRHHRADLLAALAERLPIAAKGPLYLEAFREDATASRVESTIRKVVDAGLLGVAEEMLREYERSSGPLETRNAKFARGYVALNRRLPEVRARDLSAPAPSGKNVALVLHASLPHHSNGYATRSHAVATALGAVSEYAVKPVTRPGYPADVRIKDFAERDIVDGVTYARLAGASYMDQPLDEYIAAAAESLEAHLRETGASLVHACSAFYTGLPALVAARRLGLPFVYEVRGLWEVTRASTIPEWGGTERFALESELETLACREADHVIAITAALKDELVRRGVAAESISVVPNAVHDDKFTPSRPDASLAERLGLRDAPTVGYVGSVVDYEGLDLLVEALRLLKARGQRFNFLLVGAGQALEGLKRAIEAAGLGDESFVVGRVPHEEVPAYYSLIDIAPFPRKGIPVCEMVSPLKPFEAMAEGKAIVASNVRALAEIVEDGETGLLFQKDDAADLAEKLGLLLGDAQRREAVARAGREWVLAHRRWPAVAPGFDQAYRRAAEAHEQARRERLRALESRRPAHALVYGDVNLNYIDGSAIWASSIVELLAGVDGLHVTFVLKAEVEHDTLVRTLRRLPNVEILSPASLGASERVLKNPERVAELLEALDRERQFDFAVLRGFGLNRAVSARHSFRGRLWPYLVDVFQTKDEWDDATLEAVRAIVADAQAVPCQTEPLRAFVHARFPEAADRTFLLPPMVPDREVAERRAREAGAPLRIVYAGKFAPLWGTREMLTAFATLRTRKPEVELHVYGDKIHDPPDDPGFREEIRRALESTEGIVWRGGRPREEILEALPSFDLAWAWRRPELEASTDEVSTKFLEYASAGVPMLVTPNGITRKLLGSSYPLFVEREEDLVPRLESLVGQPERLQAPARIVKRASAPFSFSKVRETAVAPRVRPLQSRAKKTILFASHDLKFVDRLMERFEADGYRILVDHWTGHDRHDEARSRALLERADVVFCEWCLGNAVWYSKHKLPFQKLWIRLHLQELDTAFPGEMDMEAVDRLVFIAPHVQRKVTKKFGLERHAERIEYIPNYVDPQDLDRSKTSDARFNLGIVGIVPQRKRFDVALDILEALRKKDPRYRLFVKGKLARDYPWMLRRDEELRYYDEQERRIERSPHLRGAVIYDGFGKDMGEWFQKIGYLLSPSDFEGSHLSVAEAMASGSSPIILNWDGADELYPPETCYPNVSAAAKHILGETQDSFERAIVANKEFVKQYELDRIHASWKS